MVKQENQLCRPSCDSCSWGSTQRHQDTPLSSSKPRSSFDSDRFREPLSLTKKASTDRKVSTRWPVDPARGGGPNLRLNKSRRRYICVTRPQSPVVAGVFARVAMIHCVHHMLENLRLCDQRAEETVSAGESNGRLDNWTTGSDGERERECTRRRQGRGDRVVSTKWAQMSPFCRVTNSP
jgi:hypothetical protein